jgi:ribonucleoside-diphosphate reductase subunit M1
MQELFVLKRNGERENISFDKVLRRIHNLCKDETMTKLSINGTLVAQKVCSQIYPGVTTKLLDELAAQICTSMMTLHSDYGLLASRIIISNHHKNTEKDYKTVVEELYKNDGKNPLVSTELFDVVMENHAILQECIDYTRDYFFSYFGFKTLEKSYLLRVNDIVVERPQHLFMRVSIGLYGKDIQKVISCYHDLSRHYYIHATPTLFNAGTPRNQLASCFLVAMKDDSINGIYETLKDCAMISKYSGGIGLHIHDIRGFGSSIKGTNGTSNGIVPMLRVFNDTARYVDQGGGKRNGSFAIYLEPWHSDIIEFLQLKKNHGDEQSRARDLFYGLWIPDLFMKRVLNKEMWSLMTPDVCRGLSDCHSKEFEELYTKYEREGKYVKQVPAQSLWLQIINSQIETGTPYLLFKDHCNSKSNQQNLGTIKSSNLCTEIIEYSNEKETAVCNLASINLSGIVQNQSLHNKNIVIHTKPNCNYCLLAKGWIKRLGGNYQESNYSTENELQEWKESTGFKTFPQVWIDGEYIGGYTELIEFTRPSIDYERLSYITRKLVRNLDRTIDVNFYPIPETKVSNLSHRPIGIGVQGFADMLMKLRYPFDSEEAREVNKKIFGCIYYNAVSESCNIAKERALIGGSCLNKYENKLSSETYLGAYSSFKGSPISKGLFQFDLWGVSPVGGYDWEALRSDVMYYGVRNSLLVAPMPTASTSQILGNHECFEPITSNIYLRRTLAGEFVLLNSYLMEDLADLDLWSLDTKDNILLHNGSVQNLSMPVELKRLYATVWEIPQKSLIDMAADRAVYICQSQSLNLFMEEPTVSKLSNMHFYSWKKGLKTGIYYLRTQPASKAQMFTIDAKKIDCLNCSA